MDFWEILTGNSTAGEGSDVWTNMESQGAGVTIVGELSSSVEHSMESSIDLVLSSSINDTVLESNIITEVKTNE